MGKRYKRGNIKRKKVKATDKVFQREKLINRKIGEFRKKFKKLKRPPTVDEYYIMNDKRIEIKRLLHEQECNISNQSYRRRTFFYLQLGKWKTIYTNWKHFTYYIFLTEICNVPLHLVTALKWFKGNNIKNFSVMKNGNI